MTFNNVGRWDWVLRVALVVLLGVSGWSLKLVLDVSTRMTVIEEYIKKLPTLTQYHELDVRMSVTESNRFTSLDGAALKADMNRLWQTWSDHIEAERP